MSVFPPPILHHRPLLAGACVTEKNGRHSGPRCTPVAESLKTRPFNVVSRHIPNMYAHRTGHHGAVSRSPRDPLIPGVCSREEGGTGRCILGISVRRSQWCAARRAARAAGQALTWRRASSDLDSRGRHRFFAVNLGESPTQRGGTVSRAALYVL